MKFRQIAIGVSDLDGAVAAWTQILEGEPVAVFNPPGFAFFNLDGVRLLLQQDAPGDEMLAFIADGQGNEIGLMSRRLAS